MTRTTIQNWEALPGALPNVVDYGLKLWSRPLRQRQPLRGPVTLNYSDGPMFIQPFGPHRAPAILKQEAHQSNAAVLARVQMLAGSNGVFDSFVLEDGAHDLWNIVELQRVVTGDDRTAPTLPNMMRRLAHGIAADAPNFDRSGLLRRATKDKVDDRIRKLRALSISLERIADQTFLEIMAQQATYEAILAEVRNLGLRPSDELVNGIAQALVAARMPTDPF